MTNTIKKEVSGETSSPIIARRTKTVKIEKEFERKDGSKGKIEIDYAKVSARVAEFHRICPNGSIQTTREFKDGWAIFDAVVTPDVKNDKRLFNGTSMGKVGGTKALEKLETIAVGRALAFAGFLSDGEIASSEEMAKYEETVIQVDSAAAIEKLKAAKDLDEVKSVWLSLTQAERNNEDISFTKEEMKLKYENAQRGAEVHSMA